MPQHEAGLDCAHPDVPLEPESRVERLAAARSEPSVAAEGNGARAACPPELTEKRAWRPSPIGRKSLNRAPGTSSRAPRVAHAARLQPRELLGQRQARAPTPRRSRRRARTARSSSAVRTCSACVSTAARSDLDPVALDGQPGGRAVAAVALHVVGGGMQRAEQVEPRDAAP